MQNAGSINNKSRAGYGAIPQITKQEEATEMQKMNFFVQLADWVCDGLEEGRQSAVPLLRNAYVNKETSLTFGAEFKNVTKFPDLSVLIWLEEVTFVGCAAKIENPPLPKYVRVVECETESVIPEYVDIDFDALSDTQSLFGSSANTIATTTTISTASAATIKPDSKEKKIKGPGSEMDDEQILVEFDNLDDQEIELSDSISGTGSFKSTAFTKKLVPIEVFTAVLKNCSAEIKNAIKDDPVTMYKQMIAWTIRCGLTGAAWVGGDTVGAYLEGASPSNVSHSATAWVGAGGAQGVAEIMCVIFIGKYLSDHAQTFKTNHREPWAIEAIVWGISCVVSGVLWQPAVNGLCSADDLSHIFPAECMAKVGLSTGATFFTVLQLLRAVTTLINPAYFRPTDVKTVTSDLLFTIFACFTDAAFVLTSTQSVLNHPGYANNSQFEAAPTLTQMGYGAGSSMLGGFVGLVSIGALNAAIRFYENRGDVPQGLRDYWNKLNVSSQCNLF